MLATSRFSAALFLIALCGCAGGLSGSRTGMPQMLPASNALTAGAFLKPSGSIAISQHDLVLKSNGAAQKITVQTVGFTGRVSVDRTGCRNIVTLKPLKNANGKAVFELAGVNKGWCVLGFDANRPSGNADRRRRRRPRQFSPHHSGARTAQAAGPRIGRLHNARLEIDWRRD